MIKHDTNVNNFGKLLEDKLYEKLVEIDDHGMFKQIVHEDKLKQCWGWQAASVDYLVDLGDWGIILIQCKWRRSRRRENKAIYNFLESVRYITNKVGKDVLFGMWISRIGPFDDNVETLAGNKIHCVSDYDSIEWLVEKTARTLTELLTTYGKETRGTRT